MLGGDAVEFTSGEVRVLVATDIAARGIHVDEVRLVVHVDPPTEHKAYLHRSGRTARAGASGTVVTVTTPDQRRDVEDLTRRAKIRPVTDAVHPSHPLLVALAGDPAPLVHVRAGASAPTPAEQPRLRRDPRPQYGRPHPASEGPPVSRQRRHHGRPPGSQARGPR